jgi:glutamine amidotransferase, class I
MPSQPTHTIQIASGSELSRVLGTTTPVNSYHHQAVKQLAADFVPVAWSTDGIIEAFESKSADQSVVAVQWHPELLIEDSNVMQGLFDNFVERVNRSIQNA